MIRTGILKEHAALLKSTFKVLDIFLILLSAIGSYRIKFDTFDISSKFIIAIFLICIISYFCFNTANFYKPWRGSSIFKEISSLSFAYIK